MRASRLRSLLIAGAVTAGLVVGVGSVVAAESFIIVDDEASIDDLIPFLTNGNAAPMVEKDDVWVEDADGKAALRIDSTGGDFQKFNPNIPEWQFEIVDAPSGDMEFRYITFAWKKSGGTGIQLQLHGHPEGWGHRYHAGANAQGWNPSIEVSPDLAEDWQLHTRDLFDDWGEFILTGVAFSPSSLDFAIYDHIVLHQDEEDPLFLGVDAKSKTAAVWADIKQETR